MMKIQELEKNYLQLTKIVKEYQQEELKSGKQFNVFKILNLTSYEVRLHSSLIAELLHSKGTHGFGNQFCKLFIKNLEVSNHNKVVENFDFNNYQVEVEKNAGLIDHEYSKGGRLDIVITDKKNNRIIIENKVYATDQYKQLWRYHQFDKNAIILYLTLNGLEPDESSTDYQLKNGLHFYCISYEHYIYHWLNNCRNISISRPRVSETIAQYQQNIIELCQPLKTEKMTNEIIPFLEKNKDLFLSMDYLIIAYQKIQENIKANFWKKIEKHKPPTTILVLKNELELRYELSVDGDGFFCQFYLFEHGNKVTSNNSIYPEIANKLKEIHSKFNTNDTYLIWFFVEKFRKLEYLDKEEIFELNQSDTMDLFVEDVLLEVCHFIKEIKKIEEELNLIIDALKND